MSNDPQESLDLFDEHEEIVSEDGKEVKRKGIFLNRIIIKKALRVEVPFLV